MTVTVRTARSAKDVLEILDVRRVVFGIEQKISLDLEIDELDFASQTIHYLLEQNGETVGAGRITPPCEDAPKDEKDLFGLGGHDVLSVHLGRLAVLKEKRGIGLGSELVHGGLRIIEEEILVDKPIIVELSAQEYACGFYDKQGFVLVPGRKSYLDAGIPHWDYAKVMYPHK